MSETTSHVSTVSLLLDIIGYDGTCISCLPTYGNAVNYCNNYNNRATATTTVSYYLARLVGSFKARWRLSGHCGMLWYFQTLCVTFYQVAVTHVISNSIINMRAWFMMLLNTSMAQMLAINSSLWQDFFSDNSDISPTHGQFLTLSWQLSNLLTFPGFCSWQMVILPNNKTSEDCSGRFSEGWTSSYSTKALIWQSALLPQFSESKFTDYVQITHHTGICECEIRMN